MNQSSPMYGVLSGKLPTGTREPPSATATITSANETRLTLRRMPRTMHRERQPAGDEKPASRSCRNVATEYSWRSSGVVRYSGKWNASTASRHSTPSVSAITVAITPWPKRNAPLRPSIAVVSSTVDRTASAGFFTASPIVYGTRLTDGRASAGFVAGI